MTRGATLSVLVGILSCIVCTQALIFSGENSTYAKFPKWNACINASLKFEFKSTSPNGLLMYTDDNGRYDFFQLSLIEGKVRLWMNVVDEKDGVVELVVGKRLNDGHWHQVEVKRNRMNTTLFVDSYQSSMMSFGSDFQFGDIYENNYVFFGGIPYNYTNNLKGLALPSSMFQSRFKGQMRNILYFNCTCIPVRAKMLDSRGVLTFPPEACEEVDNCPEGCPCISFDGGPGCGGCYDTRECADQFTTRYYLPMDILNGLDLDNPSGLDSRVYGGPRLIPGAVMKALRLEGGRQYVRVTGPGHKRECFGNLDECFTGYYIGMWLKFENAGNRKGVYMSNGGHRSNSHGIALYYNKGELEYVFKKPDGMQWQVKYNNILEGRWYHVAATWSNAIGLMLYVNGRQVAHDTSATKRQAASRSVRFNDFVIGQANDRTGTDRLGVMTIDEFVFMSMFRTAKEIRETGPFYRYFLDMDNLQGDRLTSATTEAMVSPGVTLVPGRVGNAVNLRGGYSELDYLDLGNANSMCLGDLAMCKFGFYVGMWVSFTRLDSNTRYLLSSPKGVNIYYTDNRLHATAAMVDRFWETYYQGITPGIWYFLEVSWRRDLGLSMFLNGLQVSHQPTDTHKSPRSTSDKNFYLGRANSPESWQRAGNAAIDNFQAYYADRQSLIDVKFIERVRPMVYKFPFEVLRGSRISHPSVEVRTHGSPRLIPGKLGNALRLDGQGQYVDFGDHTGTCFGNLDKCLQGATLAMWVKPESFQRNAYYVSTGKNGLTMWYKSRRLHVSAQTSTRTWELSTDAIDPRMWHLLEVSWSEDEGLQLFSDNKLLAASNSPQPRKAIDPRLDGTTSRVYLGRANKNMADLKYGAGIFDEMEYWYGDRGYLSAFGYIRRGKPKGYVIDMDRIQGNRLMHATLPIRVVGNAKNIPGVIDTAVEMSGGNQYLDIGDHSEECMGNLRRCLQGITLSAWIKFRRFENNMVYLSTGRNGLVLVYRNGYLYASAKEGAEVSIPHPQTDRWYFMEISWSPDHGLEFYMDNKLVASDPNGKLGDVNIQYPGSFYVGRGNHGDTPSGTSVGGNFDIDHLEILYGRRDDLLAMGYIDRPDFYGYETFFMDEANGPIVVHPKYVVTLVNGARLQPGKIGRAASLRGGRQYVDLGQHNMRCMGNLEHCKLGLTVSFWIKPRNLKEGDVFLSSPAYTVFYKNGELTSKFMTPTRSWTVSTPRLRENRWQKVTLSWQPSKGLRMFLDDREMDSAKGREELQGDAPKGTNIFVGKALEDDDPSDTPDVLVDEIQYYYDDIDQLRKSGLYGVAPQDIRIFFDHFSGGYLYLNGRTIRAYGGPRVVDGRGHMAISMNGQQQYLDLGQNFTCAGDLETCRQGATIRFAVKPERLNNGMYFIDSFPVKVYYRDGRLFAEMQTLDRKWEVSAPGFDRGKWQQVDVSWHPTYGLTLYLNGERVAAQAVPTFRTPVRNSEWGTYVGGPLVPGGDRKYMNAVLEGLEFWNSRREGVPTYVAPTIVQPEPPTTPEPFTRRPIYPISTQVSYRGHGNTTIIRFGGTGYVVYNFNRLRDNFLRSVDQEDVTFWFITDKPDGLIWLQHDLDQERIMHVSMKDGNLRFVNDQDPYGPQETLLRPRDGRRFNDWTWHHVNMSRNGNVVDITVDGQHSTRYIFPRNSRKVQFLNPAQVFLGGHPDPRLVMGNLETNRFDGGIAEVVYNSKAPDELIFVNLISDSNPSTIHGPVTFVNGSIGVGVRDFTTSRPRPTRPRPKPTTTPTPIGPGPITFRSSEKYLTLPRITLNSGTTVSYKFQTIKERGLMLYTHGSPRRPGAFFAVEIYDGKLYFIYDFGAFSRRVQFSERDVSDGQRHSVEVRFYPGYIILMLDGDQKRIELTSSERLPIEFQRALYLGGYITYTNDRADNTRLPWHIWSRDGYQGCVEDFQIDRQRVDLHQYVIRQFLFGNVDRQCLAMPRVCALNQMPCMHGVCRDTWEGYQCDCSNTAYTGRNCDRAALVGSLNGHQFGHLPVMSLGTHVNDLSLRFKTPLSSAFLFQTYTGESDEYLRGVMEDGRIKVTTNLGGTEKVYYAGENLNNLDWHTLYIRRRGNQIELWVDDYPAQLGNLDGENFFFNIERIYLGSLRGSDISIQGLDNYIGYMQNFRINEIDVLSELQRTGAPTANLTISTLPRLPPLIYHPVTITSRNTYVQLETLPVPPRMVLSFMFKTKESSGVILFNGGVNREFIALELYNGYLQFAFNTSDSAPALRVSTPQSLNDNKWHQVTMRRNEDGKSFTVSVDGYVSTLESEARDGRLDLQGPLYIGGLPEHMFKQDYIKRALLSKSGFKGCLASIDMSGAVPDLLKYSRGNANVIGGCTDVLKEVCVADTCKNYGVCIPSGVSYICNCNMTSYVGTICSEEATGFRFMERNNDTGLLVYVYPSLERPSTMNDDIALGFMTYDKDGVLMRVKSQYLGDFIEIRLEDGYVVAEYFTESTGRSQTLVQSNAKFNDGKYHQVRFYRNSGNATLFVDTFPGRVNVHSERHGLFDRQGTIYIGGVGTSTGTVNAMNGIVSGVYINGLRVLDMAERKVNTKWMGDVAVAPHPFTLVPFVTSNPRPTWIPPVTQGPIIPGPTVAPPVTGVVVPPGTGGGGVGWTGTGGIGVLPSETGGSGVMVGAASAPVMAAAVAAPAGAAGGVGPRAGAIVGAVLGVFALLSSMMWAFYRCKPGWCAPCGGGGGGGSAAPMAISPPRPANSNLGVHQAMGAGAGAGAGAGGGGAKVSVVNGSPTHGAGGSSAAFGSYMASSSASGGGGGGAGYDSATLRATKTFTSSGTTIGTPKPARANLGSTTSGASAYSYNTNRSVVDGASNVHGASVSSYNYEGGTADYDMAPGVSNVE